MTTKITDNIISLWRYQ